MLNDTLCLNLQLGGGVSGFMNEEHRKKCQSAGGKAVRIMFGKIHQEKMKNDTEYREKVVSKLRKNKSFLGKTHTVETKKKMSLAKKGMYDGKKNPQYGTCWITNGTDNKKIKKEELLLFENIGWRKGRIMHEA